MKYTPNWKSQHMSREKIISVLLLIRTEKKRRHWLVFFILSMKNVNNMQQLSFPTYAHFHLKIKDKRRNVALKAGHR